MSRDLTAAAEIAAEAAHVRPVLLAKLVFDSGIVHVNSSDRAILYDGATYLGVGRLGGVSQIVETHGVEATGLKLTLSGIPADQVALALEETYQGRAVSLYQGFLDANYALIADPILQWVGLIDQMSLTLGDTATITLTAESKLVRWETPNVRRYTDADQQDRFAGDLGCQFLSQVVEREILWGRTRARQ